MDEVMADEVMALVAALAQIKGAALDHGELLYLAHCLAGWCGLAHAGMAVDAVTEVALAEVQTTVVH